MGIASLQNGSTGSRYRTNARLRLPGQSGVRTLPCARPLAATECPETLAPRAPFVQGAASHQSLVVLRRRRRTSHEGGHGSHHIDHFAVQLGYPRRSSEGHTLWTGHSMRVGGAQSLACEGLDTWAIQLLRRWGSEAVLGYIRTAPLAQSARRASQVLADQATLSQTAIRTQSLLLALDARGEWTQFDDGTLPPCKWSTSTLARRAARGSKRFLDQRGVRSLARGGGSSEPRTAGCCAGAMCVAGT